MAKQRTPRQKAVTHADKWFSKYIRARDGASVLSGIEEGLNCGHVFTRSRHSTRWDEGNAFAQTGGENMTHEHDPYFFLDWFIGMFGKDILDLLYQKHHTQRKFTTEQIRAIGDYYKAKYEAIEGDGDTVGLYPPVDELSTDLGLDPHDWRFDAF